MSKRQRRPATPTSIEFWLEFGAVLFLVAVVFTSVESWVEWLR